MTRDKYIEFLDRWLADVRAQTISNLDAGTPMPLALPFAQHDIYKAWARACRQDLDFVIPPSLFPIN